MKEYTLLDLMNDETLNGTMSIEEDNEAVKILEMIRARRNDPHTPTLYEQMALMEDYYDYDPEENLDALIEQLDEENALLRWARDVAPARVRRHIRANWTRDNKVGMLDYIREEFDKQDGAYERAMKGII